MMDQTNAVLRILNKNKTKNSTWKTQIVSFLVGLSTVSILLALSPRAEKEKTNICVVTAEPTDRKLFG